MTKFQVIVLSVFVVFIVAGVVSFAMYKGGSSSSTKLPAITIWGTFPASVFNQYVIDINSNSASPLSITYKQEDPTSFSPDFIGALARGNAPDAILIPADMILPHEDKLALIPYSTLPARTFTDSYVQQAQIYANSSGIMALPFTTDPLVMYWNRDMFNSAGVATYPHYWSDFADVGSKITVKDSNGNIRKSAIAMGDFTNVDNAREILASLIMQTGNPITSFNAQGALQTTLQATAEVNPSSAFQFFAQFVDPNSSSYSWNRGMTTSKTAFLSGNLATYFGFASELNDIRTKNPNLNFDVAPLPQPKSGGFKADYTRMYGLSIVRSTPDAVGVYQIISLLTQSSNLAGLAKTMYLPPVKTDLLIQGSNDQYLSVFDTTALIGRTWLDSNPATSGQIFGNMIQSITTGQMSVFQALQNGGLQYQQALNQAISQ